MHAWINMRVAGDLCDPSLTRANLSALEMSIAQITKCYTNVLFTCFTYYRLKCHNHLWA